MGRRQLRFLATSTSYAALLKPQGAHCMLISWMSSTSSYIDQANQSLAPSHVAHDCAPRALFLSRNDPPCESTIYATMYSIWSVCITKLTWRSQYLKDIVGNNQSLLLTFSLNLLLQMVFQLSMAWLLVIQLMVWFLHISLLVLLYKFLSVDPIVWAMQ